MRVLMIVVLIGVLVLVGWGAEARVTKLESTVQQMSDQRVDTMAIAGEARNQRDTAVAQLEDAQHKLAEAQDSLNKKTAEAENLAKERDAALKSAEEYQKESALLKEETAALQAKVDQLTVQYNQLSSKYAALQQAPDKSQDKSIPVTSLPKSNPLGTSLIVMMGMVLLGSGGFIVYRMEENSKVSVRMTRDQIHDYARYQRERGNRAG